MWKCRSGGSTPTAVAAARTTMMSRAGWMMGAAAPPLMPRALFMTALVRLVMCDLFVHGTGGANYDRAMEHWVSAWLDLSPAPMSVATADVFLPLGDDVGPSELDRQGAEALAHRVWHNPEDPQRDAGDAIGPTKRHLLRAIEQAPYGSARRREAFFAMHDQLRALRGHFAGRVQWAQRLAEQARERDAISAIAGRRDWAFALYPPEQLDALQAAVQAHVASGLPDRVQSPG